MSDSQSPTVPAGWHPDPAGTPRNRWWDGWQWTENYADPQPTAPAAAQAYVPGTPFVTGAPYTATPAPTFATAPYATTPYTTGGAPLVAPAGVPIYTGFVWAIIGLAVLLPVLTVGMYGAVMSDPTTMVGAGPMGSLVMSAAVQLFAALGYGAAVWLAYLDHRTLSRAGVPSPFHWAFAFINTSVYLIGRGIVMKRRTGRGMATFWIGVAPVVLIVLAVIAAIVIPVVLALRGSV